MTRAERRRLQKETNKEAVYQMTESQIKKIKDDATKDAVDAAMVLLLGIPVKVLHDKYGWGMKKRLPEFAEAMIDVYTDFQYGELSLEEFSELIFEECGIKFKKSEGEENE